MTLTALKDTTCTTTLLNTEWAPGAGTDNPPTLGDALAAAYGEAYDVGVRAALASADAAAAVADSAPSDHAQPADQADFMLTAPYVSRSTAAHLLVGGDGAAENEFWQLPALPGMDGGFCATARLDAEEDQALQYLRIAGPSPADVTSADDTAAFFANAGIGTRLGHYLHEDLSGRNLDYVSAFLGLSPGAFTTARSRLRDEISVFDRSRSAVADSFVDDVRARV